MTRLLFFALILLCCLACGTWAAETARPPTPAQSTVERAAEREGEFFDPFAADAETNRGEWRVSDPLEPMNRAFFHLNDRLYFWVLRPAAKGYRAVAPEEFRVSIRNFFHNLRFPIRGANNLLQGKFKRAGVETARFVVNSTVGIAGLFDPAQAEWKLKAYPEDFDQTLGHYRLPPGFYLNWPLFGPSSVRGTAGQLGDSFFYISPWGYLDTPGLSLGMRAFETMNATSLRLGEYEDFKKASFDPYVALRNAYFENRRSLVNE